MRALTVGIGRSGGIVSSAMGNLVKVDGQPRMDLAFVLYAVSFAVGAAIALRPALETSRRSLVDAQGIDLAGSTRDAV